MGRKGYALVLVIVLAALAAWHFRAPPASPAAAAAAPAGPSAAAGPAPDVVYAWVDRQGVTHYAQRPAAAGGQRLVLDGSRVTPLPPPDPALAARVRDAAAGEAGPAPVARAAEAAGSGLHALRRELEQGARQMQAAKDQARHPDL